MSDHAITPPIGADCSCACNHVETKPPCVRCYGTLFIRQPDGKLGHKPVPKVPTP